MLLQYANTFTRGKDVEDFSKDEQAQEGKPEEPQQAVEQTPPGPPSYKLDEWLAQAWSLFKARILELVALQLLTIVAMIPAMAIYIPLSFALQQYNEHPQIFPLAPNGWSILISGISLIVCAAFVIPYEVGMAAVVLNYVRTGEFAWNLIWTGYRKWGICFLAGLFPGVIVNIPNLSWVLYILFPIWLAAGLWLLFSYYSLSESGASYGQAITHSLRLVRVSFWWGILFFLLAMVISFAGAIACCIGVFFSAAYFQILVAVAYNDLSRSLQAADQSGAIV
jgi:hypothetical protein